MIITIIGKTCSGKTIMAEYISKVYKMRHIECSTLMRKCMSSMKVNDRHLVYDQYGEDHIAKLVCDNVNIDASYVISGFRTCSEIQFIKSKLPNCILVYIYADSKTCYNRYLTRNRNNEGYISFYEFYTKYIYQDYSLGMLTGAMQNMDFFVINNFNSTSKFFKSINKLMKIINGGLK